MSKIRRTAAGTLPAARTVTLAAVSLALGACSLSADRAPEPDVVETPRVVRYAVEPGDRLSLIARDFTGDLELWRTLAELNGIDDPRRLAVGRVLEIPVALIPEADRQARLAASIPADPADLDDDDPADDDAATDDAAMRLAARTSTQASGGGTPVVVTSREAPPPAAGTGRAIRAASEPVVVSAVRSREAFDLAPLDEDGGTAVAGSRFVEVLGSYTPKAVYAEPASQSRLLMRITPGTVLPLERSVDGWYRVATSAGPGYLRDEDARPVGAGEPGAADAAGR